jgi:hypothetical protein
VTKHFAPARHRGDEVLIDYQTNGQRRLVIMPDAKSIKRRIALAKQHGLGGVVLFKIDGLEDPAMWAALAEYRQTGDPLNRSSGN